MDSDSIKPPRHDSPGNTSRTASNPRSASPSPSKENASAQRPKAPPSSPPLSSLPPSSPPPLDRTNPGPVTVYAKKYGLQDTDMYWADSPFVKYGKSGFTPVEAYSILSMKNITPDPEFLEDIQRYFTFFGFTAREIEEMGCYPDPNARASNLSNPIHPIFAGDKWETYDKPIWPHREILSLDLREEIYDINRDFDPGYWEYRNPYVCTRLQPVLRQVSRIIENLHTSKWIDALLLGEKAHLEDHLDFRSADDKKKLPNLLRVVHYRKETDVSPSASSWEAETKVAVDAAFGELEKRIVFGFGSSTLYSETNRPSKDTNIGWTGVTTMVLEKSPKTAVLFALESFKPLFRKDLSPSERLAEEFFLANVIVHELGHALRNADTIRNVEAGNPRDEWAFPEPYFEGEILAELGYSFCKHTFGGDVRSFRGDRGTLDGLPQLGLFAMPMPGKDNMGHSNNPIAGGPTALPKETINYPIPSSHFEKVSQNNFWDFGAKKWGLEVVRPQQVAKCVTADNPETRPGALSLLHAGIVISDKMAMGSKFAYFGRSDFEFDKLLTLTPPEVELHQQALDEHTRFARLKRRRDFRAWRARMAKSIGDAKTSWEATLGLNDFYPRRWAQLQLLNVIIMEANDELREVVAYRQESTPDDRHVCFILRLNRHLRNTYQELKDNLEPIATEDDGKFPSLQFLENTLNATFLLLHNQIDPSSEILLEIRDMDPDELAKEAESIKEIYDKKDVRNEKAEIKVILELAEQAVTDGKSDICFELGDFLNQCYAGTPTLRDIGLLLIAYDQRRNNRWKDCFFALSLLADKKLVVDEEDGKLREKWVGIATPLREKLEKIPEAQTWIEEVKAECEKSGVSTSEDPSVYCKVQ